MSITELKSVYDFLEIRKNITSDYPEHFEKNDIHDIINRQKIVYTELNERIEEISEFNKL